MRLTCLSGMAGNLLPVTHLAQVSCSVFFDDANQISFNKLTVINPHSFLL